MWTDDWIAPASPTRLRRVSDASRGGALRHSPRSPLLAAYRTRGYCMPRIRKGCIHGAWMTRRMAGASPVPLYSAAPTASARPGVVPIQRQTVGSMTVEALRERILRGDYPEGEPLRQDALADELGVSRIPVREALRQLEAEGLVTFNPHRGAVVSSLSLDEIVELFELRADIECDLLARAIPRMERDQLNRAIEVLDEFEDALQ